VTTLRVVICGFGRVGRAFAELLVRKEEQLARDYELAIRATAVVDLGGCAVAPDGLALGDLLAHVTNGGTVETFPGAGRPGLSGVDAIRSGLADVLVETTPTNFVDGEPGLAHFRAAIGSGLHIVTASKGPMVVRYGELGALARSAGVRIMTSAATAAALPTLDVALTCLAGTEILSVEGILNGTTNYILSRMRSEGVSYTEVLADAQRLGIAEPDPTFDVEGRDTANKILLIANGVFRTELSLADIPVEGITGITPDRLRQADAAGTVVKLVGRAERKDGQVRASVGPVELPANHPLATVNGSEKAISYLTDTMDRVTVSGGKSSPMGAAAALLKDVINLNRETIAR
jgi:homoserine dehydrogenase